METSTRPTHNDTLTTTTTSTSSSTTSNTGGGGGDDQLEELDIDSILRRSRNLGRTRRRKPVCEAPEFIQRLNPFNEVELGGNIVFECQCKSFPAATIKWYKDDIEMTDHPRMHIQCNSSGEIVMTIQNAHTEDEGTYRCKAENEEGLASTTGYVTITGDEPDKPLSTQSRDRNPDHVSLPPHLRTIQEQKTLEESEEVEYDKMSPSPIRAYNEGRRIRKRSLVKDPTMSDTESDDTSVDSQDLSHTVDDLLADLEEAERLAAARRSRSFPRDDEEDETDEHAATDGDGQTDGTLPPPDLLTGVTAKQARREGEQSEAKDRVPSAVALSSMFKTFVGDDVMYSLDEITQKQNPVTDLATSDETTGHTILPEDGVKNTEASPNVVCSKSSEGVVGERASVEKTSTDEQSTAREPEELMEIPWLFYVALTSLSTFIATYTDMSPILFVIMVAMVSLLSFSKMIKYKRADEETE